MPLMRMGCFAVSRVCEVASGAVYRWGSCNATFLSQCGALQGDKPAPQCHITRAGCVGGFDVWEVWSKATCVVGTRLFLLLASMLCVALVSCAQGEERGGEVCCSACGDFISL